MRDQPGNLISLRAQISGDDPAAAKRVALHILHCIEELLLMHLLGQHVLQSLIF